MSLGLHLMVKQYNKIWYNKKSNLVYLINCNELVRLLSVIFFRHKYPTAFHCGIFMPGFQTNEMWGKAADSNFLYVPCTICQCIIPDVCQKKQSTLLYVASDFQISKDAFLATKI